MKKKIIYFPSFSVGVYGSALQNNLSLFNQIPCRFYSKSDLPEMFYHPYFLITAGHFYKKNNAKDLFGFDLNENLILGDSGGFQIATGALKWENSLKVNIFNWLENNSNIAINLDIPPRANYEGKFNECLDISYDNFKYFYENQSGKTKFLNVLQGNSLESYLTWYNKVKGFEFKGWSAGGIGSKLDRMLQIFAILLDNKEHLKSNNEYVHILGTSTVFDFLILSKIQLNLEKSGSNIQVTTDSSTPSRNTAFGTYFYNVDLSKLNFKSVNMPQSNKYKEEYENEFLKEVRPVPASLFDYYVKDFFTWDIFKDWSKETYLYLSMHNFYYFLNVFDMIYDIIKVNSYHYYEQIFSPSIIALFKAIDEMFESDKPIDVYRKYLPMYAKYDIYNNVNISEEKTNEFFKF